ncbi:MAG: hypothetical protein ACT4TC_11715 [Myxococcaceae bacterium]
MSNALIALLLGIGQGMLHGLGPDHCAAIATLGVSGGRRPHSALNLALRFAASHAVVLGGLAAVCLLAGMTLSHTFERYAELLGGLVLLAVAFTVLFFPSALQHGHPHTPGHGHDHRHLPIAGAAGALMALSGVRSLALAVPALMVGGQFSSSAWTFVPGFALGVLLSMGAVGLVFSACLSKAPVHFSRWLERGVAVSSGALGIYWVAAQL